MWLTLSGTIYSRIAHLTINLQESEIYFCNFTNQLSQWFTVTIISQLHWYGRGKAISNLIVTNTSLSTQDEIWSQLFFWFTVTIISQLHWYGRGKAISNLIVTNTSLSTQDEIWSQLFLLFLLDSSPKPKIRKLAKAPTTPPETPPESPTLTYTTDPADTTAVHRSDTFLLVVIYVLLCCVCFLCRCCAFFLKRRR